jgi:hypothetical protein
MHACTSTSGKSDPALSPLLRRDHHNHDHLSHKLSNGMNLGKRTFSESKMLNENNISHKSNLHLLLD